MELWNQIKGYMLQAYKTVADAIGAAWEYFFEQISYLLNNPPTSPAEIAIVVVAAGIIIYLLYASIKNVLDASQKVLSAIGTLLSVVIMTVVPVLLAGLTAAGAIYVIQMYLRTTT
jgi:hypothetical protein